MASVASQLVEEVTAHELSDSLEDAREIHVCADSTYFPNNLRILAKWTTNKTRSRYPRLNLESFQESKGGQQFNFDVATRRSVYLTKR